MALETEIKFVLPDKFSINKIINDEFITRHTKDDFIERETYSEYYDTGDWSLAAHDYFLRVRKVYDSEAVAALKHGKIDTQTNPGLYVCQQWLCMFGGTDSLVERLAYRGAPDEFAEIVGGRKLGICFSAKYTRLYATLYLPDMVRIELSLDSGELIADGKSEPLLELGLELLYGSTNHLLTFSEQLKEHTGFEPVLLTKQQRALRLIRSR